MAALAPALELKNVSRSYPEAGGTLEVFRNVNLTVAAGEIVALVGPSGAGKSSLLHIAGLLERPTSGEAHIAGRNCSHLDDAGRTKVRRIGIGFIYQFHHLLAEFDAVENVMIPQLIANVSRPVARARARELLSRLGLAQRLTHRPAELSGGEQQRVAIARAIANKPLLLLADEPTGNLDPKTAEQVHGEFLHLISEEGVGALIATHNLDLAKRMTRIVKLDNGSLVEIR